MVCRPSQEEGDELFLVIARLRLTESLFQGPSAASYANEFGKSSGMRGVLLAFVGLINSHRLYTNQKNFGFMCSKHWLCLG